MVAQAGVFGAGVGAEGRDDGLFIRLDDIDPRQGPQGEGHGGQGGHGAGPNAASVRRCKEFAGPLI